MIGEKFIKSMAGEWFDKMDSMTMKFLSSLKQIVDRLEEVEKTLKKIEARLSNGFEFHFIQVEGEENVTGNSFVIKDPRNIS